jgi:hypothetical protein
MYFAESRRESLTQPMEHVATVTVRLNNVSRPLPQRSLPAGHGADHLFSEEALGVIDGSLGRGLTTKSVLLDVLEIVEAVSRLVR